MAKHDPRKKDPRFPDRPQHEDYYLLSEVIQDNDEQADQASSDVFKIAGIDKESAIYAMRQRVRMLADKRGIPVTVDIAVIGLAMWLDGFAAGVAFNQRRTSGDETGTAGEGRDS